MSLVISVSSDLNELNLRAIVAFKANKAIPQGDTDNIQLKKSLQCKNHARV